MPKTRKIKQQEAALREEERSQRTPAEQLARIEKRPGDSIKERSRLG